MSFSKEEREKILTSLVVIESKIDGLIPSVKKNSKFRIGSLAIVSFIIFGATIYSSFFKG